MKILDILKPSTKNPINVSQKLKPDDMWTCYLLNEVELLSRELKHSISMFNIAYAKSRAKGLGNGNGTRLEPLPAESPEILRTSIS